jgi:hypothetical protein
MLRDLWNSLSWRDQYIILQMTPWSAFIIVPAVGTLLGY